MKSVLKSALLTLLYLTPVGYILSLFRLLSGDLTPGVYIYLSSDQPIKAYIKKNVTIEDRFHWLINGFFLLFQTYTIMSKELGGDWGMIYAWMAFIFGVVNIVAAFRPTIDWNVHIKHSITWPIILIALLALAGWLIYLANNLN